MLGATYRFQVLNSLGQTIAVSSVTVKCKREKFGTDGSLTLEGSEATPFSNGSTQATGVYASGSTQDNTTDKYLGGTFLFSVTAPASASGTVTCWLQHSTDGGTTWPDDGTGIQVARLSFTTSGTKRKSFRL